MLVALICKDKPNHLDTRKANREDHLAYAGSTGVVQQAGPLLDDAGDMCGSLIILDVDTMNDAQEWAANDPYAKAGLFADVQIIQWNRVVG